MARTEKNTGGDTEEADPDKKPQYGCQLAPKLPPGVSMTDVRQQQWTIGQLIFSIFSFDLTSALSLEVAKLLD